MLKNYAIKFLEFETFSGENISDIQGKKQFLPKKGKETEC